MDNMETDQSEDQNFMNCSINSKPRYPFSLSNQTTAYHDHHHPRTSVNLELSLGLFNPLTHDETKPFEERGLNSEPSVGMNVFSSPSANYFSGNSGGRNTIMSPMNITPNSPLTGVSTIAFGVGSQQVYPTNSYGVGGSYLEGSTSVAIQPTSPPNNYAIHRSDEFFHFHDKEKEKQAELTHQLSIFPISSNSYPVKEFLQICFNCKAQLQSRKDIYIYRGDSSFCSNECRCVQILADWKAKIHAKKSGRKRSFPNSAKNGTIFFLSNMPSG